MLAIKSLKSLSILLLPLLCVNVEARSQSVSALKINDTIPNVVVSSTCKKMGIATSTKQLYSKGALIINFWATWCAPCHKELEKLAIEANSHQNSLEVIAVSYESQRTVNKFLAARPVLAKSKIIFISNDQYWNKLFFHQALPHNAWVDRYGKVKAITGGDEINSKNIAEFLKHSNNAMAVKKEVPFDRTKPVHVPDSLLTFRSIFTKNLSGVELSGSVVSPGKLGKPNATRFFEFNTLIKDLFYDAYQMPGAISNTYLIKVITRDSSRYFWPGENIDPKKYKGPTLVEWQRKNRYTFELRTEKKIADSIFFKHVISDLELNLDVKSYRSLESRNCWVVTNDPKKGDVAKAAPDAKYFLGIVKNRLIASNVPLDFFLDRLTFITYKAKRKEPYLNKTGIKYLISVSVDLGNDTSLYLDPKHIERCLEAQTSLKFTLKEDKYPILVLNDQ
jgi:thiol-disulfide isomerase/thioredoxin